MNVVVRVEERTQRWVSEAEEILPLGEVKWSESCSVMSDCLQPQRLYSPWNSLGQNTGVGSLSLLQLVGRLYKDEWQWKCTENAYILWKWESEIKSISRVWLFATLWTVAHQVPPSMGFFRQEYWSGLPLFQLPNFTWIYFVVIGKFRHHTLAAPHFRFHSKNAHSYHLCIFPCIHYWRPMSDNIIFMNVSENSQPLTFVSILIYSFWW